MSQHASASIKQLRVRAAEPPSISKHPWTRCESKAHSECLAIRSYTLAYINQVISNTTSGNPRMITFKWNLWSLSESGQDHPGIPPNFCVGALCFVPFDPRCQKRSMASRSAKLSKSKYQGAVSENVDQPHKMVILGEQSLKMMSWGCPMFRPCPQVLSSIRPSSSMPAPGSHRDASAE